MAENPPANEIAKALKGTDFPASRDELTQRAKERGGSEQVVQAIGNLPQERFGSMADVEEAFGRET